MTQPRDEGLVARVVGWLRAGYPDGVPAQDYVALLGILGRALTPSEVDRVVAQLTSGPDGTAITEQMVSERIADVLKGPAGADDVARVSARLAAAGWPLWSSSDGFEPVRPGIVTRIVGWLREGYPTAMPEQDYIPLVALLRRRLSDAEVATVSRQLVEQGLLPADRVDVGAAIARVTSELPSEEDMRRIRDYLVAHGWPVDFDL